MLLTDEKDIPALANAILSANCFGISAATKDGRPARLAIVDENDQVLEAGEHVAKAAWYLMINARNNFLEGSGHLRVIL